MRIGIVGSRDYKDMKRVYFYVSELPKDTVIVSGGARGVDWEAENAAKVFGLQTIIHRADWDVNGKLAGFLRNSLIVNDSDCIVAFWDGQSRGTLDTIQKAVQAGKVVKIYPDKEQS